MVLINLYIFILAIFLAILEIQTEGKDGWAAALPTWRARKDSRLGKYSAKFMSGKELTGYHASLFSFLILVFGMPYAFGLPLTIAELSKMTALFLLFIVLWDFLWFVMNPYFAMKNFDKGHILWHKHWVWRAPRDYYYGVIFSFFIILLGQIFSGNNDLIIWWLKNIGLFIFETIILMVFTSYVLGIDNWHQDDPTHLNLKN